MYVDLQSALFVVSHTQSTQVRITQFTYVYTNACLYLVSVHQMALPLTCDGVQQTAAYYSFIDPERMKGSVGLVSGPTADHFSHISGQPSSVGRAQDRESSPVKDQRSTTAPHNQPRNKAVISQSLSRQCDNVTFRGTPAHVKCYSYHAGTSVIVSRGSRNASETKMKCINSPNQEWMQICS